MLRTLTRVSSRCIVVMLETRKDALMETRCTLLAQVTVTYLNRIYYVAHDRLWYVAEKLDQQLSEQFVRKVVPELLKTVLTNMAVVLSKMSAFSDALNACSDAFSVVKKYSLPRDAKLLFRRGSALLSLKEFDAAVEDLDAASLLSPQDTAIATKLRDARKYYSYKYIFFPVAFI